VKRSEGGGSAGGARWRCVVRGGCMMIVWGASPPGPSWAVSYLAVRWKDCAMEKMVCSSVGRMLRDQGTVRYSSACI
jgi:hypothetical protein